jgi:hypothetical protein
MCASLLFWISLSFEYKICAAERLAYCVTRIFFCSKESILFHSPIPIPINASADVEQRKRADEILFLQAIAN